MKKVLKIATHDQKFHADEVFAFAILKRVFSGIKVIRSRDPEILKNVDMRVDVGGKYNFRTKDFDHHQRNFKLKRKNGIPYSSCGLVWKHYGKKIVNSKKAFEKVDEKLIQFIDAEDNGIEYSNGKIRVYSVGHVIDSYGPTWKNDKTFDDGFFEALEIAGKILDNEIRKANSVFEGEKIVKKILKNSQRGFVLLPNPGLPPGPLIESKNVKFVVFQSKKDTWVSLTISEKSGSFRRKKYFPKSWGGLEGKELEKASGVKGAKFCHKDLFITTAETKEAILEMTKIALQK